MEHLDPEERIESLKLDDLLRREAGAGWHENGMDPQLLKLIVAREVAIDAVVEADAQVSSNESKAAMYLAGQVLQYKELVGINDPPPLSLEED